MTDSSALKAHGRAVIELEAAAVAALADCINDDFAAACRLILDCRGRVIVTGMGKSGHIGGKIAATLASTGTPAFFVHPGEAQLGDLGMIQPQDVVIAISNSGETGEILTILPIIKRMGSKLIGMTGNTKSNLARQSDIHLDARVEKEACPHNLAPTSSTTVALALGDALAVALLKARNFTPDDFARSHPGGKLGRRLLLYVRDVMHSGDRVPLVPETASLQEALLEMTGKGLGMTGVTDTAGKLTGIYTDGDLRRSLSTGIDFNRARIADIMIRHPKTIGAGVLAAEAVAFMQSKNINGLIVVDEHHKAIGAFNMQDLLRAGVV